MAAHIIDNGQPLFLLNFGLALFDSVVGANRCAAAAADACVGINLVDVALRDSLYGTNGKTCAASDTSVSNYVSHSCIIYLKILIIPCKFTIIYPFSQIIEGKFALFPYETINIGDNDHI